MIVGVLFVMVRLTWDDDDDEMLTLFIIIVLYSYVDMQLKLIANNNQISNKKTPSLQLLSPQDVTGATNSKPITKSASATAATPSTAVPVTRWINARIVPRWFVIRVRR